jgi:hypothetical protein
MAINRQYGSSPKRQQSKRRSPNNAGPEGQEPAGIETEDVRPGGFFSTIIGSCAVEPRLLDQYR